MSDKIFLDTNILVYLANEDSPFHLRSAEKGWKLLDSYEGMWEVLK